MNSAALIAAPSDERQRNAAAEPKRGRRRFGGERVDEVGGLHWVALRQATASAFSARCKRHPHRHFAHRQPRRGRRDRLAFERDRRDDVALARRELLHHPLDVAAGMRVVALRRGQHRLEILDRLGPAHAAPPHRVDDLVAGDGVDPRRQPGPAVPGAPLQVDRQQSFLHDILDIRVADPGAGESAARHRPDRPANLLEQPPIGRLVARQGGAHRRRPFVVAGACGGCLAHVRFVPSPRFVTPPPDAFASALPGAPDRLRRVTRGGRAAKTPLTVQRRNSP